MRLLWGRVQGGAEWVARGQRRTGPSLGYPRATPAAATTHGPARASRPAAPSPAALGPPAWVPSSRSCSAERRAAPEACRRSRLAGGRRGVGGTGGARRAAGATGAGRAAGGGRREADARAVPPEHEECRRPVTHAARLGPDGYPRGEPGPPPSGAWAAPPRPAPPEGSGEGVGQRPRQALLRRGGKPAVRPLPPRKGTGVGTFSRPDSRRQGLSEACRLRGSPLSASRCPWGARGPRRRRERRGPRRAGWDAETYEDWGLGGEEGDQDHERKGPQDQGPETRA